MRMILVSLFLCLPLFAEVEWPSAVSGWEKLSESPFCPQIEVQGNLEGVNVVSGTYHEHVIDSATKGIDSLLLERSYFRDSKRPEIYKELDSPNVLGWYWNYRDFICFESSQPHICQNMALAHTSGGLLHFKRTSWREPFRISSFKGYRNDSAGTISGSTHIKNTYVVHNEPQNRYEVHFSDGSLFFFPTRQNPPCPRITIHKAPAFFQKLPSGSQIIYADGRYKTKAKDGTILNWVALIQESGQIVGAETSDNKKFRFVLSSEKHRIKGSITYLLQELVRPDGTRIHYHYNNSGQFKGDDFFLGKDFPDGRFLRVDYHNNKVSQLRAPVGSDKSAQVLYRFDYQNGYTDVFDAEGNKTRYEYDSEHRIVKKREKYRIEKNVWDAEGCLLAKILCDVYEKPYLARRFHYDDKANVIKEEFIGNLSGLSKAPLELDGKGLPKENGTERYVKHYTYSQDDFHLLTSEDDGKIKTLYFYVPGTNLLCTKLIYDKDQIRLRQFRFYDGMGALSKLIEDDGCTADPNNPLGGTLRKIKVIKNRNQFPGVGQPDIVEELYFDFGEQKEKLNKKTFYFYDKHNQCIGEEVFGPDNVLLYRASKAFDIMGRCIYEKNAAGDEIHREYDANGNLIRERGPCPGSFTEYGYDYSNRLLWEKKGDSHGSETKRFRYDRLGNCVCQMDDGGNETFFQYEGKRQLSIKSPPTPDENGHLENKISEKKYDLADRVIEEIDEEKNRTLTEYNIRGQPTFITKCKEGCSFKEAFQYDLKGNCVKKVAANGATTLFFYDFLDRVVRTEHYDKDLVLLGTTSATYNGFSLTSTRDAENVTTFVEYDDLGREKRVTKGNACVEKEYDILGNLVTQREWIDSTRALVKRFRYDLLSRVIEEKVEDEAKILFGKKAYGYDADSNLTSLTTFASEKGETTTFQFDFLGREIRKIDPLGNETKTGYRTDVANAKGQLCPYKEEIDPNGNVTETFFDARGRVEKIIRKNPLGQESQRSEFGYDGAGHLVSQKEGGKITRFKVNHLGKQTEICEEDGQDQRKTSFAYNEEGELILKETPLTLHKFTYDGWGRVEKHLAYDKKNKTAPLEIAYFYDRNGKVTKVSQKNGETIRSYDDNGNLTHEMQESGLEVGYEYDRLGRRTKMRLPNHAISYTYNGPYLYQILLDEEPIHTYAKRDLSGKIIQSEGKNLSTQFSYDLAGRLLAIQTPLWRQKGKYDPQGNLIQLTTEDPYGKTATTFSYTYLNQIASENDRTYQYDGSNNRVDGEIGPFNQLISQQEERYTWDEEGRLVLPECAYDALNRLCEDENHHYKFDGLNRRIARDQGYFLYDGDNEIGFYENGRLQELRILGEGKGAEIGATLLIKLKDQIYTPIHDIRGNITCLLDDSGNVAECTRYAAFGEEEPLLKTVNPWRFASKRTEENGLVFFGRRHYSPKMGRWTTPDPIWHANAYTYVSNNPLMRFDLYGYREGPLGSTSFIDFGIRLFRMTMSALEWIGQNLIPIPGLRDVIECTGRCLSGGKFFEIPEYRTSLTQCAEIEGRKVDGHSYIWVNGVRTTLEEAMRAGKALSDSQGGVQVYVIYNATNGLLTDLLECILLKAGLLSAPERAILDQVHTILSHSPDEMIHIHAHSQGGLHLYNAGHQMTNEVRQHIKAITDGSAKLIPDGFFLKATNYVSALDLVPLIADPIGYCTALFRQNSNVKFLSPSTWNPLKEHGIMGETYTKIRIQRGKTLR